MVSFDYVLMRLQLILLTPLFWLAAALERASVVWASAKSGLAITVAGGPGSLLVARRSPAPDGTIYDVRRPGWGLLGLLLRIIEVFLARGHLIASPIAIYYGCGYADADANADADADADAELLDVEIVADDAHKSSNNYARRALVRAKDVIVQDRYGHRWLEIARIQKAVDAQHDAKQALEPVLGACVDDVDVTQWFNDRLASIASLGPSAAQIAKLARQGGGSLMIMEADEDLTTRVLAPDDVVRVTVKT
jgi:hypothetical protein